MAKGVGHFSRGKVGQVSNGIYISTQNGDGGTYFLDLLRSHSWVWIGPMLMSGREPAGVTILDKHFALQSMIESNYSRRDSDPQALEAAVKACELQIALAPDAAKAFKRDYPRSRLPSHKGFTQLAIVREKQRDYAEAIRLSRLAAKQQWDGDWEKRIVRLSSRLAKQSNT